jgi:hypothetical protein
MNVGPFDLKDIIIGAAIIIVTAVAMFLLKGVLYFGVVLPIWILVIILISLVVIIFMLVLTIMRYLRFGKEGFLFATARRQGKAVYIDAELGSDIAEFVLSEKVNPKDVVLKDEESGIKVDPSLLDSYSKPMRFPGGLDVYIYSYYNFMPQSVRNHAAFATIKIYFDTKCRELNFLSIKEFIELISDPEHYLERNALIKLNKYFKVSEQRDKDGNVVMMQDGQTPKLTYVRQFLAIDPDTKQEKWIEQDISLPQMIQLISTARKDISVLPIMGGLLAGNEAFKYNSVAYSSQHMGHVLMLYYTKLVDEMKGKIEILTYGIVALMILIGGGVAIYIISQAFAK